MKNNYDDIISHIEDPPTWYDSNGTPRYGSFRPKMCPNIYTSFVVLMRIACQYCGREFNVELHQECMFSYGQKKYPPRKWHYGDPPAHDCVGDTMNCEDLEVLQVWDRSNDTMEWTRVKELEGPGRDG